MQEISNDYFIRLGACQGKFSDGIREAGQLLQVFRRKWVINHFFSKFHKYFCLHQE